jgi:hypothetical protein
VFPRKEGSDLSEFGIIIKQKSEIWYMSLLNNICYTRMFLIIIHFTSGQDSSLFHSVQTGSGVNPASYLMGTGGAFPGGKTAGE